MKAISLNVPSTSQFLCIQSLTTCASISIVSCVFETLPANLCVGISHLSWNVFMCLKSSAHVLTMHRIRSQCCLLDAGQSLWPASITSFDSLFDQRACPHKAMISYLKRITPSFPNSGLQDSWQVSMCMKTACMQEKSIRPHNSSNRCQDTRW